LPGILLHDLAVADLVGAANLENAVLFHRQQQRGHQVCDHIFDRDRLGFDGNPARANHHRQPLYQRTNHFK
jgi:hypothetical protein